MGMLVLISARMKKGIKTSVGIGIAIIAATTSSSALAATFAPTLAAAFAVLGFLPSQSDHVVVGDGKSTPDRPLLRRSHRWFLIAANWHVRPRRWYCCRGRWHVVMIDVLYMREGRWNVFNSVCPQLPNGAALSLKNEHVRCADFLL